MKKQAVANDVRPSPMRQAQLHAQRSAQGSLRGADGEGGAKIAEAGIIRARDEIPLSRILAMTPERPLFGHKSGKQQKTHWVTFLNAQGA